jgi:glucokinase
VPAAAYQQLSLLADVGATNIRLALLDGQRVSQVRVVASEGYSSIQEVLATYLGGLPPELHVPVNNAAIAVAGPVTSDWISLTNQAWAFSIEQLRQNLRLERLIVVNDFSAVATAVPDLQPNDISKIGGGAAAPSGPIGVIGPGSGLGVGFLIPSAGGWIAVPCEGGHVTLAATSKRESDVIERLRARFDHVSAERILSGPGLVNLHRALNAIEGAPPASYTSEEITELTLCQRDPICGEAVDLFFSFLGTIAGNLALTIGAHGGIYVAGGIVPKLLPRIGRSEFRKRFEQKGRLKPYIEKIPTFIIVHPFPAFVGLAKLLR